MARAPETSPGSGHDEPQALVGYRTNAEWNDLVAQVGTVIASLDEISDPTIRANVMNALQGIDEIHREALHRLVRLFKEGVLEQVVTDPAIRTLMGMYDLLPQEGPACETTIDFLTPEERAAAAGKQDAAKVGAGPVSAAAPEIPRWSPAPIDRTFGEGDCADVEFDGHRIILARARNEEFAIDAVCTHHHLPMSGGSLNAYTWICPHAPGCAYDVRNGARMGGGVSLTCHPVRRDERGRLLVGFGIPFKPSMPSF